MNGNMERNINDKFDYHGISYSVQEADLPYPGKCIYCSFYDHVDNKCCGRLSVTGDCRKRWRTDKKEVIFAEL